VLEMLKIKLESLKHNKIVRIKESLDWKGIDLEGEFYPYDKPVDVNLKCELFQSRLEVSGFVKTVVIHPCDRCLKPVYLEIDGKVDALYLPKEKNPGHFEKNVELISLDNTFYYDQHEEFIDVEDRIVEAIVVEIPIKVLCKEDCKGLCPYCGINLNDHPDHVCEQKSGKISPFSVLNGKFK